MEDMTKHMKTIELSVYHCNPKGIYFLNKNGCDGCGGLGKPEKVPVPYDVVERDTEKEYLSKTEGLTISDRVVCNEKKPF